MHLSILNNMFTKVINIWSGKAAINKILETEKNKRAFAKEFLKRVIQGRWRIDRIIKILNGLGYDLVLRKKK